MSKTKNKPRKSKSYKSVTRKLGRYKMVVSYTGKRKTKTIDAITCEIACQHGTIIELLSRVSKDTFKLEQRTAGAGVPMMMLLRRQEKYPLGSTVSLAK